MSTPKNSLYETVQDFVLAHPVFRREGRHIDFDEFMDKVPNYEVMEFIEELYSHILD